jgi:hypothetical protein
MNYDFISIFLLPVVNAITEPKYKNAVQTVQSVSWKKSELRKSGEIATKYVYKKNPKMSMIFASIYLIAIKKEMNFELKKALPIKNGKILINFNYENLNGFVGITVPFNVK